MVIVSHQQSAILNGAPGRVVHSILVEYTSGACAKSTVTPGKEPRWDVFTASGELIGQYADINLAAHHAEQVTGNQLDMGAWDGPDNMTTAPAFKFAAEALRGWQAVAEHADEVLANRPFDL